MRTARVSRTAIEGLQRLLDQGLPKFGQATVDEKSRLVDVAIFDTICKRPRNGIFDDTLKFYAYPVSDTPFTVVYRIDDAELRVLFIVHKSADRTRLDPSEVRW